MRWFALAVVFLAGCVDTVATGPVTDDSTQAGASADAATVADGSEGSSLAPLDESCQTSDPFDVSWQRSGTGVMVLSSQQVDASFTTCQATTLVAQTHWSAPSATLQFRVVQGDDVMFHDQWDGVEMRERDFEVQLLPGEFVASFSLFGVDAAHDFGMTGAF